MGSNTSKLRCLYLPAQSGKTRKSEERIALVKEAEKDSGEESIDIWISANNKLLVYQTTSRLTKDLGTADSDSDSEDPIIKGEIFSWTSGTKATNVPASDLVIKCMNGEAEMVVVCAHKGRLDHVAKLIRQINSFKKLAKKVNVWIDEADYSINLWSKHQALAALDCMGTITLVSATFDEVFKPKWFPELKVLGYKKTHPDVYRRLKDCVKVEEGSGKEDAGTYVEAVLDKYPHLMEPGLKAFIPGNVGKASHECISDLLRERGFAVLILNGEFKEIRLPSKEIIDLKPFLTVTDPEKLPEEFNKKLAELYVEHKLNRFPLAITGFMCVERGITFQSEDFLFDYGIVAPIKNKAEAYQAMARVFGNVGGFKDYKPCTIYSDHDTFDRVYKQEEAAVHVAQIVHEEGLALVDATVLKRAALFDAERKWRLSMNEFETFAEAKAFVLSKGSGTLKKREVRDDGFIWASLTKTATGPLLYDDVLAEMRGWSKVTAFDVNKDLERTFHSRLVVCYRDLEDPDSVVFLVRSIQRVRKGLRLRA
jgi:hypothetical protein